MESSNLCYVFIQKHKQEFTFLSRYEAIRPKFLGCWTNLKRDDSCYSCAKAKNKLVQCDIKVHKSFLHNIFAWSNWDLATHKTKTTYFSLNISFSCSVQTFMNCRALNTFIGSSIRPFMLMNLTRLCSESYIMGGMTDICLICFSLFCGT